MSASPQTKQRNAFMCVTVRTTYLDGMGWLRTGTFCEVMIGGGEHEGIVRIEPKEGGLFEAKTLSQAKPGTVSFLLPWVQGAEPQRVVTQAVDFDHGDRWLEVVLPKWARPKAKQKAAEPVPYNGVTTRVADPVAHHRGDRRIPETARVG